jgi:serine protease Do
MDQRFYRLPAGFWVSEVAEDGNADLAGIQPGDIITSFNGEKIQSTEQLQTALYHCKAGDSVEVILYRYSSGQQYTVTLILEEAEG